jgi:hypothetical protein
MNYTLLIFDLCIYLIDGLHPRKLTFISNCTSMISPNPWTRISDFSFRGCDVRTYGLCGLLLFVRVKIRLFVYLFLENSDHRSRKSCMIFKGLFKLHFWRSVKMLQVRDKSFYLFLTSALNIWNLFFDAWLMKYILFIQTTWT